MQTYWVEPKKGAGSMASSEGHMPLEEADLVQLDPEAVEITKITKRDRLVDWSLSVLVGALKRVVACRQGDPPALKADCWERWQQRNGHKNGMPRDELKDSIKGVSVASPEPADLDPDEVELSPAVTSQLRGFLTAISVSYGDLPFHNFEHACHATMAVKKLLSVMNTTNNAVLREPLVQFAMLLSAVAHDCNHPGVPNAKLVQERSALAGRYRNKSMAEQNSLDITWNILLDERYEALRACICANDDELIVFRQVLVNSIVATDLFDESLKLQRREQQQSLSRNGNLAEEEAAVTIDLIMQVANLSHTMQHWHVYQQWNRRLFQEALEAHMAGRMDQKPQDVWFDNELHFFDTVVLPLSKVIQANPVFGSTCDEFIEFACNNRAEWHARGRDLLAEDYLPHGLLSI